MYRIACAYHGSRVLRSSVDILFTISYPIYMSYMKVTWNYRFFAYLCECLRLSMNYVSVASKNSFDYPYLDIWCIFEYRLDGDPSARSTENSAAPIRTSLLDLSLQKGREPEQTLQKQLHFPPTNLLSSFPLYHDFLTILYEFYVSASPCFIGMLFIPSQLRQLWFNSATACAFLYFLLSLPRFSRML